MVWAAKNQAERLKVRPNQRSCTTGIHQSKKVSLIANDIKKRSPHFSPQNRHRPACTMDAASDLHAPLVDDDEADHQSLWSVASLLDGTSSKAGGPAGGEDEADAAAGGGVKSSGRPTQTQSKLTGFVLAVILFFNAAGEWRCYCKLHPWHMTQCVLIILFACPPIQQAGPSAWSPRSRRRATSTPSSASPSCPFCGRCRRRG